MCRELYAPGSVFCPSTSQKLPCQSLDVLHALQQLQFRALCVGVPAPTAWDGITLCTTTESFQSPQPAGCASQQAGKQAGCWQPGHMDCGPEFKRSLASGIHLEREQGPEVTALGLAA